MVPLEKELDILKTFLDLKKTFQPEAFSIQFHRQVESLDFSISPLLLLSVTESCLDNLYQKGEPPIFLNLIIKTMNRELHFQLECKETGDPGKLNDDYHNRLLNSMNKIELLHAGRKTLDLFSENGTTYLILVFALYQLILLLKGKLNEMPMSA